MTRERVEQAIERSLRVREFLIARCTVEEMPEALAALDALTNALAESEKERERLRAHINEGHALVGAMDARMPENATEDADGFIDSYRIPVGPWHRLLAWAQQGYVHVSGHRPSIDQLSENSDTPPDSETERERLREAAPLLFRQRVPARGERSMTKAKVHIEAGLFGKAACGKRNVDVTKDLILVTCANCQRDSAYREWIADQDLERSGVVGQP